MTLSVENGVLVNETSGEITLLDGNGTRTLNANIDNFGSVQLEDARSELKKPDSVVNNHGVFTVLPGVIAATSDNNVTFNQLAGSLLLDGDLRLDNGQLLVSGGGVTINDSLTLDSGAEIKITGGSIRNDGFFQLNRGVLDFRGGDIRGTQPVQLRNTVDLNVTHDGSLNLLTRDTTNISGTLFVGQALTVGLNDNSRLVAQAGFENQGTIVFDNPDTSSNALDAVDDLFVNAETGLLRFTGGGNPSTQILTSLENRGAIEVDARVTDFRANTLTNGGTFLVTANGRYSRAGGGSGAFVQADGLLTVEGEMDSNGIVFDYDGGDVNGTVGARSLNFGPSAGNSGTFVPRLNGSISGVVQQGQTVIIENRGIEIDSDLFNSGEILLRTPSETTGDEPRLTIDADAALFNTTTGVIRVDAAVGENVNLVGTIDNLGTVQVDSGRVRTTGIDNSGTVRVDPQATLFVQQRGEFIQRAGTLQIDGTVDGLDTTFRHLGGAITDTVILFDSNLELADGVEEASFQLQQGGNLLSNIPANVTVTLSNRESGATDEYDGPQDLRISGSLILGDNVTVGESITFDVAGALTIEDVGSLIVDGAAGSRNINSRLVNNGTLTINAVASLGRNQEVNENRGRLHLNDAQLTVRGSSLENAASGAITGTGDLVLANSVFDTAFTNAGLLAAGQSPGLLSVTATSSSLTPTSVIQTEIAGTTAGTTHDQITFNGDLNQGGTLQIQVIDGHQPQLGDTHDVLTFDSAIGNIASVVGQDLGNGIVFTLVDDDPSKITLTVAEALHDLDVDNVVAPRAAISGQAITVSWTVTNRGDRTNAGTWQDSIYLTENGVFNPATSKLLGRVIHNGDLAFGESYSESLTARVPAVLPDDFQVVVITDSGRVLPDSDLANNSESAPPTSVSVPSLGFGQTATGTLADGEEQLFQIDVPAGRNARFTTTVAAGGAVELMQRQGGLPTFEQNDQRSFNPFATINEIVVLDNAESTFVLIKGRSAASNGTSFNASVSEVEFQLQRTNITSGSNSGSTTVSLFGFPFSPDTKASLIAEDGSEIAAVNVQLISGSQINATFNLVGADLGVYDIQITDDGETSTLEDAFSVVEGIEGGLESTLTAPDKIRSGRRADISVDFVNAGNSNAPAKIQFLLVEQADIRLDEQTLFFEDVVEFLATDSNGSGVFPPNATNTIEFVAIQNGASDSLFHLLTPNTEASLNHDGVREDLRPQIISPEVWDSLYDRYIAVVGSTYASYQERMAQNASELAERGVVTNDVSILRSFEFLKLDSSIDVDSLTEPQLRQSLRIYDEVLDLDALLRLQGGGPLNSLRNSILNAVVESQTDEVRAALEQQLGAGFNAALSDQDASALDAAILPLIDGETITEIRENAETLQNQIAVDNLAALDPFRNAGLAKRTEIQSVFQTIENVNAAAIAELSPSQVGDLLRGIGIDLDSNSVTTLIEQVNAQPLESLTSFLAIAENDDVDDVLAQVDASLLALFTPEQLQQARQSITGQLKAGITAEQMISQLTSSRVTVLDLLLAASDNENAA
ncbi:MAG: CARDB domain-containing protein, partial [Planctomycetota bacterium]